MGIARAILSIVIFIIALVLAIQAYQRVQNSGSDVVAAHKGLLNLCYPRSSGGDISCDRAIKHIKEYCGEFWRLFDDISSCHDPRIDSYLHARGLNN